MRLLCLHVNSISYEAVEEAFDGAEDTDALEASVGECLAVFTAVEERDEADVDAVVTRAVEEIADVADQVNVDSVVVYPYVHLTASPGSPEAAKTILQGVTDSLPYETYRSPFGWYKSFSVDVKGHPLAELSREFGPESGSDGSGEAFTFSDCELDMDEKAGLSTALLVGHAVTELFPEAELGSIDFHGDEAYVDVDGVQLGQEHVAAIKDQVREYIAEDVPIRRGGELSGLQRDIAADTGCDVVYSVGDTCVSPLYDNPFVSSAGSVAAFDILHFASAYWRGNESNDQLTRIYTVGFGSDDAMERFRERRREAEERDHMKIGREMNLFSISEVAGPGLPLYHPPGKTVLEELRSFMNGLNEAHGYDRVETPHLFKADLWKESGHYDSYHDDMFLFTSDDTEFGLKAMNCPGHAKIYQQSGTKSYRDLPIRYYENGKVYRKEQTGELSGLSRVWAFTIDDGHVFVRRDQIKEEIRTILHLIQSVTETFDIETEFYLATQPDNAIGSDSIWEESEEALRDVLDEEGISYEVEGGDGAFYGPKIDVGFRDALGRSWDGPTVQLDFNMPERFDLTYKGEDNEDHRPVLIHRALYGSYERFFMVLIEQYKGQFPSWLAPEQVRILPVTDDNLEYAERVREELGAFRTSVERRSWTVGKKVRAAHTDNVPYMLIVGDDEEMDGTVSVRDRDEREASDVAVEEFAEHLREEVGSKRAVTDFLA